MGGALYGHEMISDLPMERLRPGPAPRGPLVVRAADGPLPVPDGPPAFSAGRRFRVYRHDGRITMWCGFTGVYDIDPAENEIAIASSAPSDAALEHRLACIAIPMMLGERGDLALHASAVVCDGRAVAFAAPSHRGKSTTAAVLGQRGYQVLAEDGCVITTDGDEPLVWPGLRGVQTPQGLTAADGEADPVPLAAVALLGPRGGDAPTVAPVPAVDALTELMPNTMHALGASQAAAFRGAAALVRSIPIVHATLPDDLAAAADHAESLLRAVLVTRESEAWAARRT
jgi:hypothetical protein